MSVSAWIYFVVLSDLSMFKLGKQLTQLRRIISPSTRTTALLSKVNFRFACTFCSM